MRKHLVIPDPQCKPGVPLKHLGWVGRYAAEKRPDVVIHLGDHYDLPSLSSYDRDSAKREFHNRSFQADLDAGDRAFDLLEGGFAKARGWRPTKLYLIGNHEERFDRLVGEEPRLEGALRRPWAYAQTLGWKVVDFLEPIEVDGILYAHFFCRSANGMVVNSKRGAPSARAMVQREMQSCTAGHKQGLDVHAQPTGGGIRWGLIAGSCYLHQEKYLTPQGTQYWRGIVVKHEVRNGNYNPMFVSLDYLGRRFK